MNAKTMWGCNILITGATGFVGTHLIKRLLSDGWNVHIITRPSSDINKLEFCKNDIKIHEFDGKFQTMVNIIRDVNPVMVFHLASLFIAEHQSEDISRIIQSNIEFGTFLAEALVKNNVFYLINTGTSWQHYQNEEYNPVCLYAATKQAFEDILKYYEEAKRLKVVNLKLFDTYGPNDYRKKLFSVFKNAENAEMSVAMSEGNQLIDLVYIDDVIEAFIAAQKYLLNSQTNVISSFAISSGDPIKLRDLAELYGTVLNKNLNIDWGKRTYREREVMVPWNKGIQVPGWHPRIGLREGISKLGSSNFSGRKLNKLDI